MPRWHVKSNEKYYFSNIVKDFLFTIIVFMYFTLEKRRKLLLNVYVHRPSAVLFNTSCNKQVFSHKY